MAVFLALLPSICKCVIVWYVTGTRGDSMYFIEHGQVEIKLPNGVIITTLADGSYFGGEGVDFKNSVKQNIRIINIFC